MVDYGYYKGIYLGKKIDNEGDFQRLAMKSKLTLKQYTFNRISKVTDKDTLELIKWTICELVDTYIDLDNIDNVKQESLGDSSFTYRDKDVDFKKDIVGIINRNLGLTGLLRRGW